MKGYNKKEGLRGHHIKSLFSQENIMENLDLRYYAKVHSIESFGTVDGPRN